MDLHALFASYNWTLSVSEEALFQKLLDIFIAYNTNVNLSAIRDKEGIIVKHFIDSLSVLRALPLSGNILDI
jgi:16S rRNA (guanine527-N7)-methyltransferase